MEFSVRFFGPVRLAAMVNYPHVCCWKIPMKNHHEIPLNHYEITIDLDIDIDIVIYT